MTVTVRLPDKLETELRERLKEEGRALSEFVRDAIVEKIAREPKQKPSPWELGKDLFGKYGSGDPDASTKRKERIEGYLDAKHHRRQRSAGGPVRPRRPSSSQSD